MSGDWSCCRKTWENDCLSAGDEVPVVAADEGEARRPANWEPRESNLAFNSSAKGRNKLGNPNRRQQGPIGQRCVRS